MLLPCHRLELMMGHAVLLSLIRCQMQLLTVSGHSDGLMQISQNAGGRWIMQSGCSHCLRIRPTNLHCGFGSLKVCQLCRQRRR